MQPNIQKRALLHKKLLRGVCQHLCVQLSRGSKKCSCPSRWRRCLTLPWGSPLITSSTCSLVPPPEKCFSACQHTSVMWFVELGSTPSVLRLTVPLMHSRKLAPCTVPTTRGLVSNFAPCCFLPQNKNTEKASTLQARCRKPWRCGSFPAKSTCTSSRLTCWRGIPHLVGPTSWFHHCWTPTQQVVTTVWAHGLMSRWYLTAVRLFQPRSSPVNWFLRVQRLTSWSKERK